MEIRIFRPSLWAIADTIYPGAAVCVAYELRLSACDLQPSRPAKGFTLLELLAVVAIMALFATMLVTRIGGRGEARLRQAEALVLEQDAYARRLAEQRHAQVSLLVDLTNNSLAVFQQSGRDTYKRSLPPGVLIERALTSTEIRGHGEVVALIGADGAGTSYAVKLRSNRDATRWIVIAGGTGQPLFAAADDTNLKNTNDAPALRDRDVEAFFRSLRKSAGADAP